MLGTFVFGAREVFILLETADLAGGRRMPDVAGEVWDDGGMTHLNVVLGDITTQHVDAIVNAANRQMRGGGGVDGAIHAAAGPVLLQECIRRFPDGLATGEAGWTPAGDLPADFVIHTPGPNYRAGERDVELLRGSYRNCLRVADELGVKTIAFPLLSAGIFGWPLEDAIQQAVMTLATTPTGVEEMRIVVLDPQIAQMAKDAISEVGAEG